MTDERRIRDALSHRRVQLWFQPILRTEDGKFSSAEALARMRDERGNLLMPGDFIPFAEENGLISELGEVVLEQACSFLERHPGANLSVNLSPLQLEEQGFAERCRNKLRRWHLSPERMVLEITETAEYRPSGNVSENLRRLAGFGFGLALDDMGTGASDLRKLDAFPFRIVKLDRQYIAGLEQSPGQQCLVKNIILYARRRGVSVVAEGVEERSQAELLAAYGCGYQQGFYYSRPLPEEEYRSRYL